MDKQRPTVQHKELCSMLPGSLDGRRAWERMNTLCVCFFSLFPAPAPVTYTVSGSWLVLLKFVINFEKKLVIMISDRLIQV